MGLAELLGGSPDFSKWFQSHRNALTDFGVGLASQRGLGGAASGLAQGGDADYQRNLQKAALDLQSQQRAAAAAWARDNGYEQYAPAIEAGAISGSDIFNLLNKQTVVPQGSSVVNGRGETVTSPQGGQFLGTGMDAQNWNIVMKAQSNPSLKASPQFQAAWAQLSQPQITYQQTPSGLVPIMKQPNLPAGWGPPTSGDVVADTGGPAPQMGTPQSGGYSPTSPDVAPLGGVSVGQPLPGTRAAPTEAQGRNSTITTVLLNELPNVNKNFAALADPKGQLLGMLGPIGNPWQSSEYQRAASGVSTAVSDILYSLSGASSNPGEVINQIRNLTPQYGDKPEVVADKLNRFNVYVRAIAQQSGDPQLQAAVEKAITQAGTETQGPQDTDALVNKYLTQ